MDDTQSLDHWELNIITKTETGTRRPGWSVSGAGMKSQESLVWRSTNGAASLQNSMKGWSQGVDKDKKYEAWILPLSYSVALQALLMDYHTFLNGAQVWL